MKKITTLYSKIAKNQFFRFTLIGGFCALQNTCWLYLLTTMLGLHYAISTVVLTLIVNSLGYYLNRRYTFKLQKKQDSFWQGLIKYHLVMLSSFLTVLFFMYVLVELIKMWYLYAHLLITIGMTLYNFLMHKKWTFK